MSEIWMTESEKRFFVSLLTPEDSYLEWGSGGSTLEAARIVNTLVSIEHDEEWYKRISPELAANRKPGFGYDYRLVPSDKPRSFPHVKKEEFLTYINEVHEIDKMYDKVLIDGRARVWCAEEVREYLNPEAIVMFHDWDRPFYHQVIKWYKIIGMRQRLAALKLK